jgi:hypothetical protein
MNVGPTIPLPHTWRPLLGRVLGIVMAVLVAVGAVLLALFVDAANTRLADRIGIGLLGVPVVVVLLILARPRLDADEHGLTVVNLVRRRRVSWPEVVAVGMAETQSWASLDLTDGTALPVLALQTADGRRYRRSVDELNALIDTRGTSGPLAPAS